GPGGQNVNKLNTKAELWIALSDIHGLEPAALQRLIALAGKRINRDGALHLSAQSERTQEANRNAVIDRLRILTHKALTAPTPRKPTKPSKSSKRKRLETKRRRAQTKASRRGDVE